MKNKITDIVLVIIFIVGFSILIYPILSNHIVSKRQMNELSEYVAQVDSLNNEEYSRILEEANKYNEELLKGNYKNVRDNYNNILRTNKTDIMGYIIVDSVNIKLPIYHGVSDAVLQVGVGHKDLYSLPVGGLGTHSLLFGHRGLPSAELFSDLDKVKEGDIFRIVILNEELFYKVYKIEIVLPDVVPKLKIEKDKDYVTLVTCTPYGINSHRLLIRGERTYDVEKTESVFNKNSNLFIGQTTEIKWRNIILLSLFVLTIFLLIFYMFIKKGFRRKK